MDSEQREGGRSLKSLERLSHYRRMLGMMKHSVRSTRGLANYQLQKYSESDDTWIVMATNSTRPGTLYLPIKYQRPMDLAEAIEALLDLEGIA